MKRNEFNNKYWCYYLLLESDFVKTNRFVQINEDNYKCYSLEFAKLLQAICGELDSVLKVFLSIKPNSKTKIGFYYEKLKSDYGKMFSEIIKLPNYDIILKPFDGWDESNPPGWWSDYNKIKHRRGDNLERATLENVLNALAALFLVEMHALVRAEGDYLDLKVPKYPSKIFYIINWGHPQVLGDMYY